MHFHKSGSGIVLNNEPKFNSEDVIIPFVDGPNGLQYVEEYSPEEETVMATSMVAERLLKLTNADFLQISLCHVCPTFA